MLKLFSILRSCRYEPFILNAKIWLLIVGAREWFNILCSFLLRNTRFWISTLYSRINRSFAMFVIKLGLDKTFCFLFSNKLSTLAIMILWWLQKKIKLRILLMKLLEYRKCFGWKRLESFGMVKVTDTLDIFHKVGKIKKMKLSLFHP
jgi:hypothetical protein